MKTYIGIKVVEAQPSLRPSPTSSDPLGQDDGYRVRYRDGYESWSPKAAFEEAYVEVDPDRKERILLELMGDLYAYIGGGSRHSDKPVAADDLVLRNAALDFAIAARSPVISERSEDFVTRARAFYDFLVGVPVAPVEPRAVKPLRITSEDIEWLAEQFASNLAHSSQSCVGAAEYQAVDEEEARAKQIFDAIHEALFGLPMPIPSPPSAPEVSEDLPQKAEPVHAAQREEFTRPARYEPNPDYVEPEDDHVEVPDILPSEEALRDRVNEHQEANEKFL